MHSNDDGVAAELKNGKDSVMRRDVLKTEHPVVIVHPVTKQKALCEWPPFPQPGFCSGGTVGGTGDEIG